MIGRDVRAGADVMRRALSRHRAALVIGTVLLCIHQLAETSVAVVIGVLIDVGIAPGRIHGMIIAIAALGGVFVVLTASYRLGMRRVNDALHTEAHLLRMEVSEKALSPRGMQTDLLSGELVTISSTDADQTAWFLDLVPRGVAAAVAVIATAIALLFIDIPLGLAALTAVPVVFAVTSAASTRITTKAVVHQSRVAAATALAGDLISGARSIAGIGAEDAASNRYRTASRSAQASAMAANRSIATQRGVTAALSGVAAAAIASTAGWFALTGRITTGELVTVVGLAQFLIEPLTTLSALPATAAKARGSSERVAAALTAPPLLPSAGGDAPVGAPGVRVRGVYHRTLQGLDLDARAGELTAVFAHDSADGDALASVLSGRAAPQSYRGSVVMCGSDLRTRPVTDLARRMLAEPHEPRLFAGTIGANLTAWTDPVDAPRLARALSASRADQVVETFGAGLQHCLSDRGHNLSGGQRQRLALARALYAGADVLILHEPTTAIDSVTEQRIAQSVRDLRCSAVDAPLATVIITTSPALLAVADRVAVVRHGRLVSEGAHRHLLQQDPLYAEAVAR